MTTENTVTEVEPTPTQIAENFVKENTTSVIVEEFVNHYNKIENLNRQLDASKSTAEYRRVRLEELIAKTRDFLLTHIANHDGASVDELKELAEELDIELTKEIEVTFRVEVTATVTVPVDFDEDDITDSDFDISVEYSGTHNDAECDSIEYEVNNFVAEEA
jgi:Asp-tRNA(Asn)/Glu-tRNA(Gln) amidotransferase A subunit family amidase